MELKHINLNIENKSLSEKFKITCDKLQNLDMKMDNETKLKFYGLYKVSTCGKFNPDNTSSSLFDFQAKYKNQAWEKFSNLTTEQAMIEYISLYHKFSKEPIEEDDLKQYENVKAENDNDFDIDGDFEFEVPQELEENAMYSSDAKKKIDEINEYKKNLNEDMKLFMEIKEMFYNGDIITSSFLKEFENENKIKLENFKDETGQTLLHLAVDSMNNSAVGALSEIEYATKMLNIQDTFGMTPMHIAAINFDLGIFSFLIQMKPNEEIKDSLEKTYIEYLKENEDIDHNILKSLNL